MILPPIKRVTKEDLTGAPPWIDRFLYSFNLFLNTIYGGLNKNITFQENINAQIATFSLVAGAAAANNTASFGLTLKQPPVGLWPIKIVSSNVNFTPIAAAVFVEWLYDGTLVQIKSVTGLANGTQYNFTVVLI